MSDRLHDLFARRPWQGVHPCDATLLFIGLDPNYEESIDDERIFDALCEYHDDGAAFWTRHGVHHPFLLPSYPSRGSGRFFHASFARIGFDARHASQVSFVELVPVPTVGRNLLTVDDLDAQHLRFIDDAMRNGAARHVFLSSKAIDLLRRSGVFPWLPRRPIARAGPLAVFHRDEHRTIYKHLHFSVYGKFTERKAREAAFIRTLADDERAT